MECFWVSGAQYVCACDLMLPSLWYALVIVSYLAQREVKWSQIIINNVKLKTGEKCAARFFFDALMWCRWYFYERGISFQPKPAQNVSFSQSDDVYYNKWTKCQLIGNICHHFFNTLPLADSAFCALYATYIHITIIQFRWYFQTWICVDMLMGKICVLELNTSFLFFALLRFTHIYI